MDFWGLYSRHIPGLKKSGSQWLGPCPFPGCKGKAEPKFYIDPSTGQFHCKRCDAKGNAITFAKYFNEDPGPFYDPPIRKTSSLVIPKIEKLTQFQEALLTNQDSWLSPWKPDAVQALRIGWDNGFVFPVFDQTGEPLSLIWHKKRQTTGATVCLYPAHLIIRYNPSYVVICEGLPDCASLFSAGIQVATSTGGARGIPNDISDLKPFKTIYLCLDNDEHGEQGTEKWITRLQGEFPGAKLRVCDLSSFVGEGGDVTDYLSLPDKNRDTFISEVLERARVGRPFSDVPDFVRQTILSNRFTSLDHRDRLIYSTLVFHVTRYRLRTAEINGLRVLLQPGEYVTSYEKLAEICPPYSKKMMRTSLRRLQDARFIRRRDLRERRGQVITLVGWWDGHTEWHTESVKIGTPKFPVFSLKTLLDTPQDGRTDFPGLGTDVGQVNSYNSGGKKFLDVYSSEDVAVKGVEKNGGNGKRKFSALTVADAADRNQGGGREPPGTALFIPRDSVYCGECRHIIRDPVNPRQGWAQCQVGGPATWPMKQHSCDKFESAPSQEIVEL